MPRMTNFRSAAIATGNAIEDSAYENVKLVADNIDAVASVSTLISEDDVDFALLADVLSKLSEATAENLAEIATADLELMTIDLAKGAYLGNRKIDINLALNMQGITQDLINQDPDAAEAIWVDPSKTVLYDSAEITFVDGATVTIDFTFDSNPITISTHGDLLIQLTGDATFLAKLEDTSISGFATDVVGELVRLYDIVGSTSNIEKVILHAVSGQYTEEYVTYYWAKTTSALQTLSMRAADIIKLGNDIDSIILLANSIEEVLAIQERIPEFIDTFVDDVAQGDLTLYNKLTELDAIYQSLVGLIAIYEDIAVDGNNYITDVATDLQLGATSKISTVSADLQLGVDSNIKLVADDIDSVRTALSNATTATEQAGIATAQASIATDKADEITAISGNQVTQTLVAGSSATAFYDSNTGKFTFGLPQGVQGATGDKGDSFEVNAVGLLASRGLYDGQSIGFSFLAIDSAEIYFKLSNTSGDWSVAAPFGKGETGNGIDNTSFTSTTAVSGLAGEAGETDTYTITYTNAAVDTFVVTNGTIPTKLDLGLDQVDNTSDTDKAVSTATQTALDLKADLVSPTLTGVPIAPTANIGTDTTQIATTAFVLANSGGGTVDTTNFDNNLSAADDTVQKALETLDGLVGGTITTTPILSFTTPVNEGSTGNVITISNYDADATYTFGTDVGTVNYTNGSTATFTAKDVTDGNDDIGVITCSATKAGELRSEVASYGMTITYVPIVDGESIVNNDFSANESESGDVTYA